MAGLAAVVARAGAGTAARAAGRARRTSAAAKSRNAAPAAAKTGRRCRRRAAGPARRRQALQVTGLGHGIATLADARAHHHLGRTRQARGRAHGLGVVQLKINRQVTHLTRLVDDLLDVSRIDAGALEPHMQRFSLRDLFRRLHLHFAGQAEAAGLSLRLSPGGAADLLAASCLAQALAELPAGLPRTQGFPTR